MDDLSDIECVNLTVTKRELRYLIACGSALAHEIIAVTLKLRALADSLGIDM